MNKIDCIEKAKKEKWNVCVYGLGYLGKRLFVEIPTLFNLSPNYYSDGNDIRLKETRLENMEPICKKDLLEIKEPMIVFILVDNPYDIEIQNTLNTNSYLITFTLRELTQMEKVINLFYGEKFFQRYLKLSNYEK